jgi:hypothetical protein
MRVYIAVFALRVIAAMLTSEPCCGSNEVQVTPAASWLNRAPVGTERNQTEAANKTETVHNRPSSWCTALKDSQWWLVIIAALTGIAISLQAREMARSTGVMRNQWTTMQGQLSQMQTDGNHTKQLAEQAVRQSDLTQRQFDLANRPWIAIDFVKAASNLEFREGGDVLIWLSYRIQNVGHSVAQHISPWIEPIISGVDNPVEVRARISEQLKKPKNSPFDHGKLIFPNGVIIDRYPLMIRPEALVKALDKSPFKNPDGSVVRGIGLELFVCFDYQSTLDSSKHHQTQSLYLVAYRGNGLFVQSQKSYGVDGLTLTFKGFGAYAD